jgi:CubicO group peptidase (beta-lactamase class C family)
VTDRIRRALLGTFVYSTAAAFVLPAEAGSGAEHFFGVWSAFLEQDDPPTRLKLVIDDDHSGHLTVIDAGEVPILRLKISGETLHLEIAQPPLIYNARLAGDRISGMCRRGDQDIALDFVRGDLYTEPPLINFPPAPLSARRLHELRVMARAPAMGVGWQFRGEPGHVLVDGNRSIDAPVAVTRKDKWHLGSITKSMTATLAARIVETGALQWNARIGDVLGSVVTGMRPEYRDITLLHILSHRGGLPRDLESMRDAKGGYLQRRDYVEAGLRMPPVAAPGERTLYSNVDYVVAGLMLETVGRQPWETLIAHHVFEPLGIRSFGFGPPGSIDKLDQPQGHEPAPRGLRPTRYDVPEAMAPAGRVHMNLDDLLLYLVAHRDRPNAFLKEASWQTLHTPPFGGDYALGWSVSSSGVLSHGGTNQKWKAEVVVDRERELVCGSAANVLNNNTQSALLQLLESARLSA